MKYPKIRQPGLCMFVLTLPWILAFFAFFIIGMGLLLWVGLLPWLLYWVSAGIFLFRTYLKHRLTHLEINELLNRVLRYRISNPVMICPENGTVLGEIEQRVRRRAQGFGEAVEITPGLLAPVCLRHRHREREEACLAVYVSDTVDENCYDAILADARERFLAVPDGRISAVNGPNSLPRIRPWGVILLANRVEESVRQRALAGEPQSGNGCIVPCVAECSTGKYYLHDLPDSRMVGDTWMDYRQRVMDGQSGSRDLVAYDTLAFVKKVAFGFGGPRADNPVEDPGLDLELSLWDALAEIQARRDRDFGGSYQYAQKMLETMENRELHLVQGNVFLKEGDRLTVCPGTLEGNRLRLQPCRRWLTKVSRKRIWMSILGHRMETQESIRAETARMYLTVQERQEIRQNVEHCLRQQGYEVLWEGEDTV